MNGNPFNSPDFVPPVGTQIVILHPVQDRPVHAVAVITELPDENLSSFTVRFPDGYETSLARDQFAIKKHFERGDMLPKTNQDKLFDQFEPYIIYRCVIGSRAYGLDTEASDTDRRGIFLPPAEAQWSLQGVPEQIERPSTEETYWELEKFIRLALKANPNILECLHSPLIETITPIAEELLSLRSIFLSKMIYQTYNGYILSQFKKMNKTLKKTGSVKWKHAMHLIRLLVSGISILENREVLLDVGEYRERLLTIKRGELSWEEVNDWRLALHQAFDEAYKATALPERPDYEQANMFLIKARRSMVI